MVHGILHAFSGLTSLPHGKELIIFIISMMPILELRGGLIAAALLKLQVIPSFIICLIGNLLPLPFILWFITPIFNFLKNHTKMKGFVERIERKALKKKDKIANAEFWGLLFFVGVPLPGTGGWTGCLIAALLGMDKKKALLASSLGVV